LPENELFSTVFGGFLIFKTLFVAALTSQSSNMRILEVGAGAGASTECVLSLLEYAQYIFTEVSSAFFDSARQTLKRYFSIVSYQTSDME
jgi:predicted O-methyltransferase YrrM